jgi:hypothetical protein
VGGETLRVVSTKPDGHTVLGRSATMEATRSDPTMNNDGSKIKRTAAVVKTKTHEIADDAMGAAARAANRADQGAKKSGHRIQEATDVAAHAIEEAAQKAAHAAHETAQKVMHRAKGVAVKAEHAGQEMADKASKRP